MKQIPFFLYATAGLLTLSLILIPYLKPSYKQAALNPTIVSNQKTQALKMQNAVLTGDDGNGQRYTIRAAEASHPENSSNLDKALPDIMLKDIQAILTTNGDGMVKITAERGFFESNINTLLATGMVSVKNQDGLNVETKTFAIDLATLNGESGGEVYLTGPGTTITAPGAKVLHAGQRIIFTGNTTGSIQD